MEVLVYLLAVVASSRQLQVAPSIYIYIHVLTVKVPLRCQHAQFLITTSFTVSRKLEILSNFEHIAPNIPVKEGNHTFFPVYMKLFCGKGVRLIKTYKLCDLDLTLIVQLYYCTMVVYLVVASSCGQVLTHPWYSSRRYSTRRYFTLPLTRAYSTTLLENVLHSQLSHTALTVICLHWTARPNAR